ncbi:ABC transporter substrate-binding protein [Tateyamaria sp.]|uniref:ABC transporter substrate-binding protein n=1 Tax=Tateyamaria sp. TaxID=1929288 RepID=UPI003B216763
MTRIDRRALFASGAAAALLAATGVSAAPKRGGRLKAALSSDMFDKAVAATVFNNLTEIGADGTLRGELATDWTSDQDGLSWQFSLRDGVTFHDGTAFDARVVDLPFNIRTLDRHRVEITLEEANPNLPYLLAQPGFEQRSAAGFGTGLYQVQKLDKGRHFIGARVEGHWKSENAGWFDSVEFVQFGLETVRSEALRDGLVDVADIATLDAYADPRDFQTLRDGDKTTFIASQTIAVPATVGKAWPLDNLRMAERWWMA